MSMSFEEVKGLIKQRFPIMMVDRVLEIEPGTRIKTLKNITGNELHFMGHFPDYSIMPGVFIMEAIAQSASILFSATSTQPIDKDSVMVLGGMNNVRFFEPVLPGYTMIMEISVVKIAGELAIMEGIAKVEDKVAAKGTLTFGIRKPQ